ATSPAFLPNGKGYPSPRSDARLPRRRGIADWGKVLHRLPADRSCIYAQYLLWNQSAEVHSRLDLTIRHSNCDTNLQWLAEAALCICNPGKHVLRAGWRKCLTRQ